MSSAGTESNQRQSRISLLARPKGSHPGFREDKRSLYWVDRKPLEPGPDGFTIINATPRVQELAKHRQTHPQYAGARPSPIWPVREASMHSTASDRTVSLGQHRPAHHGYQMDRSPYTQVSSGSQKASASARIEQLSTPKNRDDRHGIPEKSWGQYIPVSSNAMQCKDNPYIDRLAEPKPYHSQYLGARPVQWEVGECALKAIAPLRLQQLSRPLSRTLIRDDYDPYLLTSGAKSAKATPRVQELSVPWPRKVRQKIAK